MPPIFAISTCVFGFLYARRERAAAACWRVVGVVDFKESTSGSKMEPSSRRLLVDSLIESDSDQSAKRFAPSEPVLSKLIKSGIGPAVAISSWVGVGDMG